MKIFLCCSRYLYPKIPPIREQLENAGHLITLPNSYDNPGKEEAMKLEGAQAHVQWKSGMIRLQKEKVEANEAILVLNLEKNGMKNYIGGATFLEIFKAFELGRKIFLLNPIPDSIFRDELLAIQPIVLDGEISKIDGYLKQ